jgi:ABC transport system ATP-binding/permease protein
VFLVSHDRRFLDNVVTSTIVHEGEGRWREYVGDVQDWMTQSARAQALEKQDPVATQTPSPKASPVTPAAAAVASPPTAKRKLSYKEQRELEALPDRIAALEAEQVEVEKQLDGGALYASDPARAAQLGARYAEIENEWLEAMERLEALSTA